MEFVKSHGLGNDFVLIDASGSSREQAFPPEFLNDAANLASAAKILCHRQLGVGADGLILVMPSREAAVRMRVFNPDGSEAEMCGNGVRCLAAYAYESGLVQDPCFEVETGAGMIGVRVIFGPEDEPTNDRADGCGGERAIPGRSRRVRLVEVDMGRPILVPKEIPVLLPAAEGDESADDAAHSENAAGHDPRPDSGPGSAVRRSLEAGGRRWTFTAVSMGNPHCVIFVDDPAEIDLGRFGPLIEHHPAFPRRINVEFVKVDPAGDLHVKVWERGAGVTLACGTGGCASLVAAVLEKRAGRKATVHLAGGPLQVEWRDDGRVMMTGPVQEVFRGHVSLFDFLG